MTAIATHHHPPITHDTAGGDVPAMLTELVHLTTLVTDPGAEIPCRENDAELWFALEPAEVEFAKALCATCPLQDACLAGALDRREPWGVWDGQLLLQGEIVARKRPRGRPRKNDVAA